MPPLFPTECNYKIYRNLHKIWGLCKEKSAGKLENTRTQSISKHVMSVPLFKKTQYLLPKPNLAKLLKLSTLVMTEMKENFLVWLKETEGLSGKTQGGGRKSPPVFLFLFFFPFLLCHSPQESSLLWWELRQQQQLIGTKTQGRQDLSPGTLKLQEGRVKTCASSLLLLSLPLLPSTWSQKW